MRITVTLFNDFFIFRMQEFLLKKLFRPIFRKKKKINH